MTKQQQRAVWLSILVLGGGGIFLHAVSEILLPFMVGLVLAYLISPLVEKLSELGIPRPIAAAIPITTAISILTLILILGLPMLIDQLTSFARRLPVYLMTLENFVLPERLSRSLQLQFSIDALLRQVGLLGAKGAALTVQALQQTLSGAMWLLNIAMLVVMTPLVAFYLLMDWPKIIGNIYGQLPKTWRGQARSMAQEIDEKMAAYLRGTVGVCLCMAVYYAVALSSLGGISSWLRGTEVESLELGLAIGAMTGLLAFLPLIGASVGVFTMFAVALVQYQLQMWEPYALIMAIFVIGQLLEGYVMTPVMVGQRVGLHPLWILFALLAGGVLAGIMGMLAAVPMAVVVSVLLPRLLKTWRDAIG
jgi:predicted PurR-regulated permease PerM